MFRKKLDRVQVTKRNVTFFQYKIADMTDNRKGARLQFIPNEWLTCFLIPSERELNFNAATKMINQSIDIIKKTSLSGIYTADDLSKLSFLHALKKLISECVKTNDYKKQAESLLVEYVLSVSKVSVLTLNSIVKFQGIYKIVDPEALRNFKEEAMSCFSKVPTTLEAIHWWKNVKFGI